jgi:hypothetical protein
MNKKWTIPFIGKIFIVLVAVLVFGGMEGCDLTQFMMGEADDTKGKGFLEGTVMFIGLPCPPEELNGREPRVPPCDGPYPNYEITVYQTDGKTIVAKGISDANGHYEISLNAGNYLIYTPSGLSQNDVKANRVTIVEGETTKLDLVVDTGVR